MEKPLAQMTAREIKSVVAKRYGEVAIDPKGKFNFPVGRRFAESVGYSRQLLDKAPSSLWESFTGAGNPQPYIDVTSGETVLDLGCGAGLDLYLYAQATGPEGRVYGLDLSEEMVAKAKHNMEMLNAKNVEFLCAPADNIPLPDKSVDIEYTIFPPIRVPLSVKLFEFCVVVGAQSSLKLYLRLHCRTKYARISMIGFAA
ncbi:2-methoxy-6-polyprenyl-1,4-benzoquinol methylase [subsurface metagenome]